MTEKHFAQTTAGDLKILMMLVYAENISGQTHEQLVMWDASGWGICGWWTGLGGRNLSLDQWSHILNFVPYACIGYFLKKLSYWFLTF